MPHKPKSKKLTLKEQRFVDAYLGECHGNGTLSAARAGYVQTYDALRTTAKRLLTKAHIQAAIKARTETERKASIISADRRDEILSEIAEESEFILAKISAIKELNKCSGRHSIKHLHEGKLTLEQALEASRKP